MTAGGCVQGAEQTCLFALDLSLAFLYPILNVLLQNIELECVEVKQFFHVGVGKDVVAVLVAEVVDDCIDACLA